MEAVQTTNPPSFETVWAILQENAMQLKEMQKESAIRQKESAIQLKEMQKEGAIQLKEMQKEGAIQMKEIREQQKANARLIGKLGHRMGEVVEYMVAPNLREKFRELGYDFPKANQSSDVSDRANNLFLEIDIMLENGDKAMLVEAKTKPSTEDVQEHIERLEKMRKYADLHDDKRTFLGAVAGVVMTDNVKEYALKQGFFVIEPSGETFNIIPPNKPKEW